MIDLSGFKSVKEILAHKDEILRMKKAEVKRFAFGAPTKVLRNPIANKAMEDDNEEVITREIIGNTYLYMDSHQDVHVPGIFTKSIQENERNINHLYDHKQSILAKVGNFKSVNEVPIKWTDLGIQKTGETIALLGKSKIKRNLNDKVFDMYKSGEVDQHSVGMLYVKIEFAANDPSDEASFKVWEELINLIGNREEVEKQGYFFAVREAKLFEISAVLMGSNPLTPTKEPLKNTPNNEPPKGTQKTSFVQFLN